MVQDERRPEPDASLWRDRLGRWSIRSLQVLLILGLVTVLTVGFVEVSIVVIPLIIALIIASAAAPLISWLRRHRFPPMLAAWTTLLAALGALGGLITLIVVTVRNQWVELSRAARAGYQELKPIVLDLPAPFSEIDWDAIRDRVVGFITSPRFGVGALSGVGTVVSVLTGTAFAVVLLFFFLKDGDQIWAFFTKRLERDEDRARAERVGRVSVTVLGGYLRGTALIALVDAVAIGVGLAILRVPLALPLAVLVFLGSFIPYAGSTLAGTFAVLVALVTNGPVVALIVVIIVVGVNQLEGDLLQPIIMSQSVSLHPLVVLVALAAGTVVSGIVGALLAVPVTAVAWAIIKVWEGEAEPPPPKKPGWWRRWTKARSGVAS
jgi:predicted PurR-regulated permease PerM